MATGRCARFWNCVLDVGLTLWVLRAIVVAMLFGFAILDLAPQAQDLLVDVATRPWWYHILFLLSVFFVWAMPTHYAARLLVETDARYLLRGLRRKSRFFDGLREGAPRVLGLLPFVATLISVARSWNNVPAVDPPSVTADAKQALVVLGIWVAACALVFWLYMASRRRIGASALMRRPHQIADTVTAWVADRLPRALVLGRHAPGLNDKEPDSGPVYLLCMFVLFSFLPFLRPVEFAEMFPRAIAVPFVLAGWTPLAAYASGVGRYLRVPIISLVLLASALLTYLLGDNYSVRLINVQRHLKEVVNAQAGKSDGYDLAQGKGGIEQRPQLDEVVRLWQRANNCELDGAACPRPIIIAASGGASRAGFYTASVIGRLLDKADGLPPHAFRKRLFAISSVSGSSVGAVMTVAALAASEGEQPCNADGFWLRYDAKVTDWRSCLEALTSGDFLTPVFAGLVFRDTLRFIGALASVDSGWRWSDRASLIEQSWERHFRTSLRPQAEPAASCLRNLDCPFLTLRPHEAADHVVWLPLLLLNGASVSTGQRIVTSTIYPWYWSRKAQCPLVAENNDQKNCPVLDHAYDFHWLIHNGAEKVAKSPAEEEQLLNDVRLSTAAHNSARFPLISPPGEVRDQLNNVVDRIVDGGYFENFGAQTALELATAIRTVEPKLVPFVLIISNDPEIPTDNVLKAPDAADGTFLTDLSAPAKTIMNTRAARGTLALDAVANVLGEELMDACAPNASHLRVFPEYEGLRKVRPLSFSWWLSKPVQQRLNQQTDFLDPQHADNQQALCVLAGALAAKPSGCAGKVEVARTPRKYEGLRPQLPQGQRQRP